MFSEDLTDSQRWKLTQEIYIMAVLVFVPFNHFISRNTCTVLHVLTRAPLISFIFYMQTT